MAAFLFRMIGHFSLYLGGIPNDSWLQVYLLPFSVAGVFGWNFVWISYRVAPTRKQATTTTMTWLLAIFNALNILFAWQLSLDSAMTVTLGSVAAWLGALVAWSETRQNTPHS